ncbi:MAG: iron ABC transporter permease [Ignisphaera sp.]|nr:iron ABC transporter permease [Ignisphaera sp.]MCX8168215.1 iron ABC transporter permease [Ignisphaera sp.]MDW8084915.1 iron ABC transporter permease [Ignisphaera sp.]
MALELYRISMRRFLTVFSSLSIVLLFMFVLSLSVGSTMVNPIEVFNKLLHSLIYKAVNTLGIPHVLKPVIETDRVYSVATLRLGRTIAAISTGALLGVAGLLMQTATRNPLAEPYILGLSSTALTTIAIGIILVPNIMIHKWALTTIAFIGALLGFVLTILLSRLAGGTSISLVLSGIAINALFSGISHTLLYVVQNTIRMHYVFLLMGSTSTILLNDTIFLILPFAAGTTASLLLFKILNTFLYGDEYAKQFGYSPSLVLIIISAIASVLTASTVATVGIVGFVGLAAPHISRLLVGTDHRFSLPITAMIGAMITTIADVVVRIISLLSAGLGELPLGVITSTIGAPFLAYLIIKRMKGHEDSY